MDIVITGRHVEVKERFRRHLHDKLAKVSQLGPHIQRLDVVISHEANRRQPESCERIEITGIGKGPVVRAEAAAEDQYIALDRAYTKLLERLRRAHDRKVLRRGRSQSLAQVSAKLAPTPQELERIAEVELDSSIGTQEPAAPSPGLVSVSGGIAVAAPDDYGLADSPIHIRQKVHAATPMTIEQALYEMELVGHDFFLFCDAQTLRPSAVYRRRGWEYGVLHLDIALNGVQDPDAGTVPAMTDESRVPQPAVAG